MYKLVLEIWTNILEILFRIGMSPVFELQEFCEDRTLSPVSRAVFDIFEDRLTDEARAWVNTKDPSG